MTKRIFISHIHEEAPLGTIISAWVTDIFDSNLYQPFLSSDHRDLSAGEKSLDVVRQGLSGTAVMVSLVSPASLARPWINIELGAAWSAGVSIIPLCHSGQTIAALPRPFGDFQAVDIDDPQAGEKLLGGIAKALGVRISNKLHFMDFQAQMREAAGHSQTTPTVAPPLPGRTTELSPEKIAILQMLATSKNVGETVDGPDAPRRCGLKAAVFEHHADSLNDMDFVRISYYAGGA